MKEATIARVRTSKWVKGQSFIVLHNDTSTHSSTIRSYADNNRTLLDDVVKVSLNSLCLNIMLLNSVYAELNENWHSVYHQTCGVYSSACCLVGALESAVANGWGCDDG